MFYTSPRIMNIWRCLKEWQWYPINPFWCTARCQFRWCYQEHCKAVGKPGNCTGPWAGSGRPKSAAYIGPQQQFRSCGRSLVSRDSTWSSSIISVWHSSQDSGSQSRSILTRKLKGDTLIIKVWGKCWLCFFVCSAHTHTHKNILYIPLFPSLSCLFNLFFMFLTLVSAYYMLLHRSHYLKSVQFKLTRCQHSQKIEELLSSSKKSSFQPWVNPPQPPPFFCGGGGYATTKRTPTHMHTKPQMATLRAVVGPVFGITWR